MLLDRCRNSLARSSAESLVCLFVFFALLSGGGLLSFNLSANASGNAREWGWRSLRLVMKRVDAVGPRSHVHSNALSGKLHGNIRRPPLLDHFQGIVRAIGHRYPKLLVCLILRREQPTKLVLARTSWGLEIDFARRVV
ncbi:hypothetical protein BDP67DRAFT_46929 [Colletotrichum lupini]|nr:hypothetical protein BDP67DRAFT_46929 [Colletotrichum lupini]